MSRLGQWWAELTAPPTYDPNEARFGSPDDRPGEFWVPLAAWLIMTIVIPFGAMFVLLVVTHLLELW